MLHTKTILIALAATAVITACSKSDNTKPVPVTVTNAAKTPVQTTETPKEQYARSLGKFKMDIRLQAVVPGSNRAEEAEQFESMNDEGTVGYISGAYVGDPYDDVTAADGYIVQAASLQEEEQTRVAMSGQVQNAKNYLNYHGLDLSDEYSYDDPRYIHAANIVMEMESTTGIPVPGGSGGAGGMLESRENSTFGCVMQAIGITSLYNAWFDKFATKRMLIAAVGKLATRYLGWVGAAVAVYDFIDCMWG